MDVHDFHATCDDAIDHGKRRSRYGVDPAVFASNRPTGFGCRQEHHFHRLELPVRVLIAVGKCICIIFMEPTKARFCARKKNDLHGFLGFKKISGCGSGNSFSVPSDKNQAVIVSSEINSPLLASSSSERRVIEYGPAAQDNQPPPAGVRSQWSAFRASPGRPAPS